MALIPCPECGAKVYELAHICPQCGFPMNIRRVPTSRKTAKNWKVMILISVMAMVFGLVMLVPPMSDSKIGLDGGLGVIMSLAGISLFFYAKAMIWRLHD